MNSVKNRSHAVMSFLAYHTAACSMIGYHSNSWASCVTLLENIFKMLKKISSVGKQHCKLRSLPHMHS